MCRVLDAKAYEKLHRVLVTNLGKCALSLVREAARFDGGLVRSFCDATVKEHYKFALSKDRIYKVGFFLCCLSLLLLLSSNPMPIPSLLAMCFRFCSDLRIEECQ